jgi:hypothetical protein
MAMVHYLSSLKPEVASDHPNTIQQEVTMVHHLINLMLEGS